MTRALIRAPDETHGFSMLQVQGVSDATIEATQALERGQMRLVRSPD